MSTGALTPAPARTPALAGFDNPSRSPPEHPEDAHHSEDEQRKDDEDDDYRRYAMYDKRWNKHKRLPSVEQLTAPTYPGRLVLTGAEPR